MSVAGGGVPTGTPKGLHRAVVAAGGPLGLLGVCQSYCGWGWCPLGLPRVCQSCRGWGWVLTGTPEEPDQDRSAGVDSARAQV